VYFTPVFGGLVGDRVLGRRNAVALGALLMTAGFAGFGMLAGLIIYVIGRQHVPVDAPRKVKIAATRLTPEERRVVLVLILLLPALTMFWIAQSQIWNVYNLWARDHVDLIIAGWNMPVPWLQSIDGIGAVALVPPVLFLWRRLARRGREPDDVGKLGLGCLLFGAAVAWLACGQLVAPTGGKVPLVWAVGFHFLSAIGYLHVQPVAIGLFARTAPKAVNAMMIGVYFLSIFVGSTISGRLGGLYEQLSPLNFWLLHAAIVSGGGSMILLFARPLRRELVPHHFS
jgi:POT family proton-dependent oligopeptide transporter